ncbi:MAG: alpha/beta fold hydrolase [Nocardioides sp.]|uniref:alpha/beta fold hydrolase n=1 Tax=Nocardioides sp. TaxID=35761 RepID=UPI0032630A5F
MVTWPRRFSVTAACTALVLTAGCAGETSPPQAQTPSRTDTATETPTEAEPEGLAMTCSGSSGPVVVLEAGLDTSGDVFEALVAELGDQRVCISDRAGVGISPPLASSDPDPWPGSAADALAETLAANGQQPPYVMLGWSYGGMVAQAFATRHPDLVAGLVLEDASVPEQFEDLAWQDIDWVDGGRPVNKNKSVKELSTVDFGDLPVVVLTADYPPARTTVLWTGYQQRLTRSTTNAVHLLAVRSDHEIHVDALDLVAAAVREVVSAGDGDALKPCDPRFTKLGGRCLP